MLLRVMSINGIYYINDDELNARIDERIRAMLYPPAEPAAVPAYRAPGERMVTADEADHLRVALTEARAEVASSHTAGFREGVEAAARKIEDADWGDFADLRSAIADSVRALTPPTPAAAREADLSPKLATIREPLPEVRDLLVAAEFIHAMGYADTAEVCRHAAETIARDHVELSRQRAEIARLSRADGGHDNATPKAGA